MIYAFITEHAEHPAARWATFFEVSTSGYYSWLEARPDRQSKTETYAGAVEQIFDGSGGTYGADRIAGEMRKQRLKASFRKVKQIEYTKVRNFAQGRKERMGKPLGLRYNGCC